MMITAAVISAVNSAKQAQAQQDAAQWQADQAEANANAARQQAEAAAQVREADAAQQELLARKRNASLKAENRANAGAQGVDNTGTSLLNDIALARDMELNALEVRRQGVNDAAMIRWQGELTAANSLVSARGYQFQADNAAAAKGWNTASSAISGGASGLSLTTGGFELFDKAQNKFGSKSAAAGKSGVK